MAFHMLPHMACHVVPAHDLSRAPPPPPTHMTYHVTPPHGGTSGNPLMGCEQV